jgi:hypothetical protein
MKKNLFILLLLSTLFLCIIISCENQEEQNEKTILDTTLVKPPIIKDSITCLADWDTMRHAGGIINLSIMVMNKDNPLDSVLLENASVMITINGCYRKTIKTDQDGIAVFQNLRVAEMVGQVSLQNQTTVNFVIWVKPLDALFPDTTKLPNGYHIPANLDYYEKSYNYLLKIPLFSIFNHIQTEIEGSITYETDLINSAPEPASICEVVLSLDADNQKFREKYFPSFSFNGYSFSPEIKKITYSFSSNPREIDMFPIFMHQSTVSDEAGKFQIMTGLVSEDLPIKFNISEIARDQNLLMNTKYGENVYGVQICKTIFSSEIVNCSNNYDLGYVSPSYIPVVPPAYVVFSAPEGVVSGLIDAQAIPIVSKEGKITGIQITNPGRGYSKIPEIVIKPSVPGRGQGAEAVAILNEHGSIKDVIITKSGENYTGKNYFAPDFTGNNASDKPENSKGKPFLMTAFDKNSGKKIISTDSLQQVLFLKRGGKYQVDFYMGTGKRSVDVYYNPAR